MSAPDRDDFATIVAFGGVALDAAQLDAIAEAQRAMWPALEALRAIPLPFLDAIEPGHALHRLHGEQP